MNPVTYPARPLNGGRFGLVPKKPIHLWSFKVNGWRALIHTPSGTMFNRHGQELSIANEFTRALESLRRCGIEWLDCEAFERRHNLGRGSLIILDAIVPKLTATQRWSLGLTEADRHGWPLLALDVKPEQDRVYLMKQMAMSDASRSGKLSLASYWGQMQAINQNWQVDYYEGLVAKRADSIYPIQLRSAEAEFPFWVKHRWRY
jgi:hypothetical protein